MRTAALQGVNRQVTCLLAAAACQSLAAHQCAVRVNTPEVDIHV